MMNDKNSNNTDSIVRNICSGAKRSSNTIIKRKNQVPDEILHDKQINDDVKLLPLNYNFEIHKCIWRIKSEGLYLLILIILIHHINTKLFRF